MRDRRMWTVVVALLGLSVVLYAGLHALYPDRPGDIGFYTLLDIAFIPLNLVLVGLVLDRLLAERERAALLHKMNMVVGAFFSETGTELIARLATFDTDAAGLRPHLVFAPSWTARDFAAAREAVRAENHPMDLSAADAAVLRDFLVAHRAFLLRLLENPNLLEHGSFTDALWAVTHLSEELSARRDLSVMPPPDIRHVELDMGRAYGRLLGEWLGYVRHLKTDYPYLFSFAVRTNPFDPDADIEVRD
jgi:hypothetical protein